MPVETVPQWGQGALGIGTNAVTRSPSAVMLTSVTVTSGTSAAKSKVIACAETIVRIRTV